MELLLHSFPNIDTTVKNNNGASIQILLISLLEYFCKKEGIDDEIFMQICKYLIDNQLIDINYLEPKFRNHCIAHIKSLKLSVKSSIVEPMKTRYYNDFNQLDKIGQGGQGIVYKVVNKFDKIEYAIKKIYIKSTIDSIYTEVKHLSKLDHPNVIRYYGAWIESDPNIISEIQEVDYSYDYSINDAMTDNTLLNNTLLNNALLNNTLLNNGQFNNKLSDNVLYIQMQLCKYSLKKWLENRTCIDLQICKSISQQIINGLEYIHNNNIIHLDIKPDNIFMFDNNQIKIGDFGMAINKQDNICSVKGTYVYASPEQLNNQLVNMSTDIYSLGIVLYEIFHIFGTNI